MGVLTHRYGRSGEIIAFYDYVRVFTVDNWTEYEEEARNFLHNLFR